VEVTLPEGFKSGEDNKSPAYLAKFPLGKVPTFESPSGFLLSESVAIAEYVARKGSARAQLLGATDEEAVLVRQWMCFNAEHLIITLGELVLWRVGVAVYDKAKDDKATKDLERWLEYLEGHLGKEGQAWLVMTDGGKKGPSMADLYIAEAFSWFLKLYMDREMREQYPAVVAWYGRVKDVDGFGELFEVEMIEKREPPSKA